MKFHIKKGDLVKIIAGKEKNSEGVILSINTKKGTVCVVGKNLQNKRIKKKSNQTENNTIKVEGPIHVSNIKKT